MTLSERLSLIRAGYKAAEIREMEKEGTEQHEPQPMESRDGMEQQQSTAAGAEGENSPPEPEAQEQGEIPDDPRDAEIRQLKEQLAAAQRNNINSTSGKPYGDDEYIRDVFARRA